ncbi:hypothetical protein GQR58_019322 [Nymphon striatum]|nr:hypothetical protein GQR58_019322 [Nymphon striatum]
MTNFSHSFALGPLMPSQDSQVHYMRTSQDIQGQLEITLALVLEIILVVVTLQMKVCGTFLSNVVTTFACDVLTTFYNVLQTFACDVLTTLMTVDAMVDTVKCTEVAAEAAISAALKYAPDRRGGGGRKGLEEEEIIDKKDSAEGKNPQPTLQQIGAMHRFLKQRSLNLIKQTNKLMAIYSPLEAELLPNFIKHAFSLRFETNASD